MRSLWTRGGGQRFSWIHINEVLRIIRFPNGRADLDGVFNASAPHSEENRTFMRSLRRVLGTSFGLPSRRSMLELGSVAIRTETGLVLKSRWVSPERLQEAGYHFEYPDLEPALRQIVPERRK